MANVMANDAVVGIRHMAEFGNTVTQVYDIAKAVAQNDKIYFGKIPAGTRVTDVDLNHEDCGTGCTLDLGYSPVDGTNPTEALTYWFSNRDVATAAAKGQSTAFPIKFDYDVWLVGTVESAAFTGTPRVVVTVTGLAEGAK